MATCPSSVFKPRRPWPSRAAPRTWARRRWSSSACGTSRGWSSSSTPSVTCWPKHRPTAAVGDPTSSWGAEHLLLEPRIGTELCLQALTPRPCCQGTGEGHWSGCVRAVPTGQGSEFDSPLSPALSTPSPFLPLSGVQRNYLYICINVYLVTVSLSPLPHSPPPWPLPSPPPPCT